MADETEQNARTDTATDDSKTDTKQAPVPVPTENADFNSVFGSLATEQIGEVASDEDTSKQDDAALPFDLPDDVEVDKSVVAAFKDYDEDEVNPQAPEFYDFPVGDDFKRNGRF